MPKKKSQRKEFLAKQNPSAQKGGGAKKLNEKPIAPSKIYSKSEMILIAVFAFVIIAAGYFMYRPALEYDLVYCDDNIFLQDYYPLNKAPNAIEDVFNKTMGTSYYRPMLNVSIILDTRWSLEQQFPDTNPDMVNPREIKPGIFHRTNVLFHLIASLLAFVFLLRLGYPVIASFLFSMIVVVHPLLTPAASWISGRNDSMITVFMLISFIAATFYFEKKSMAWKLPAFIIHVLFFWISLYTKEVAAFFPFIIFAWLILFHKRKKIFDGQYLLLLAGQFIVGLVWFFMRLKAIEGIKNPDTIGLEALPDNILTLPALVGKFFLPIRMIALSSYEWFSISTGFFFIGVIIAYLIWSKKIDKNRVWFGVIWFGLLLFPTLLIRIVYVDDFFDYAEHRAYLVMIGLIIFVIEVLKIYKIDFKKPIPIAAMMLIILLMGYKSYGYRDNFQNRKTFWTHMTEMYPYKSRGYLDLGKAYLVEDSLDKAEKLYKMGIERNPDNRNLYIDLAAVYLKRSDFPKAEQSAKKALLIEPGNTIAHYNLARAYFAQGRMEEARVSMEAACRQTRYPDWFKDLGDIYYRTGKFEIAIQAYRRALQGNPRNYYAFNNMGLAFANLNKFPDAKVCWNNTLQINPKMYEAYYNLIRVGILVDKNPAEAARIVNLLKQQGGIVPPEIGDLLKSSGVAL